ncbi:MAG: DUF2497 domain-containing protein, partial [Magnetococcales bacterium]|nr:DUF2497 domain-containing protein [Magnetococcales bacterium]
EDLAGENAEPQEEQKETETEEKMVGEMADPEIAEQLADDQPLSEDELAMAESQVKSALEKKDVPEIAEQLADDEPLSGEELATATSALPLVDEQPLSGEKLATAMPVVTSVDEQPLSREELATAAPAVPLVDDRPLSGEQPATAILDVPEEKEPSPEPIVSADNLSPAALQAAFGERVERMVEELARTMLEEMLPGMLEEAIRQEIERIRDGKE